MGIMVFCLLRVIGEFISSTVSLLSLLRVWVSGLRVQGYSACRVPDLWTLALGFRV